MGLMYGSVSISQYLPQFLPLINAVFHFRGECLLPVVFSDIFYGISYSIADCFISWVGSSWIGLFLYLIYACFICTANALKSFAKHGFTFFCPIYIYSSYTSGFYFTISYIWFYFFPMIRWCYLLVILGWIELFLWCRKRFPGWMPLYWISSQNAVSYFSIIVRLIVSNSEGFLIVIEMVREWNAVWQSRIWSPTWYINRPVFEFFPQCVKIFDMFRFQWWIYQNKIWQVDIATNGSCIGLEFLHNF